MSEEVFPDLPGLTWDGAKSPEFRTTIVPGADGSETPIANWANPLWHWTLKYELLRDDATDELRTLMGFFLRRLGRADDFLYDDPSDNAVTGQLLGIGNGATTTFQAVRSFGGFVEDVKNLKVPPVIYVAGVPVTSGWSVNSKGLITFAEPPANGAVITADLKYYWRVRFDADMAEFNEFAEALWEMQELKLVSKRRQ